MLGGARVGPQFSFVIFGGLFAGGVAYVVTRRLQSGPELIRDEWILMRDETAPPQLPTVKELVDRLAAYGFAPTVLAGDQPATTLWQTKLTLRDPALGPGELRCELGSVTPPFFATVEIDDNEEARYGTLANCLLFELGELIPGLRWKRTFSNLPEEPTAELAQLLPPRRA